nr:hypothetical protein Iba_chr12cCG21060 [Ipomoea batatas]
MDRSNRYKSNKRTPLNEITITPTTNDTIGSQVVIDRSNESTVTTLTHNVSTSIMECRNLNKDFNEACTEEDTTITESIEQPKPEEDKKESEVAPEPAKEEPALEEKREATPPALALETFQYVSLRLKMAE